MQYIQGNGLQAHAPTGTKPGTSDYMLYDPTYTMSPETVKLSPGKADQTNGCLGQMAPGSGD